MLFRSANLEHDRWAGWQKWCHKILRENCPSPELEKVLERWDRQIATNYSELSKQEKESDRKETRNYLPLITKTLLQIFKAERERLEGEKKKVFHDIKAGEGGFELAIQGRAYNSAIQSQITHLSEVIEYLKL